MTAALAAGLLALGQLQGGALAEVQAARNQATRAGMATLTAWAAASVLGGGAGWLLSDDPAVQGFHQSNLAWGLVNGALGVVGLVRAEPDPRRVELAAARAQASSEQTFYLVNAGLDLVYLGTGAVLAYFGGRLPNARLGGWGRSFLLQAAVLLIFDLAMAAVGFVQAAPLRAEPGRR